MAQALPTPLWIQQIEAAGGSSNIGFAQYLLKGTKDDSVKWGGNDDEGQANITPGTEGEVIAELIARQVRIGQLLDLQPNCIFRFNNRLALLTELHKQWVQEEGLNTSERMQRQMKLKHTFTCRGAQESANPDFVKGTKELPLDLVDAALQYPYPQENPAYTMQAHIDWLSGLAKNVSALANHRKTELALLILKNLLDFEKYYKNEVEKNSADADAKAKLDQIKSVANQYRRMLFVQPEMTLDGSFGANYEAQKQTFSAPLATIANNGRLRRAVQNYIIEGLLKDDKKKLCAILEVEGHSNVGRIARMMSVLDAKDMEHLNSIMANVLNELQSQHNLSPYFSGSVSRNLNWLISYPINLVYWILDLVAGTCEYMFRGTEFKSTDDIIKDATKLMEGIKSFQPALSAEMIQQKSKLQDAILEFLGDYKEKGPSANVAKFKQDLGAISLSDTPQKLKDEVVKLQGETNPITLAKEAYTLLKNPEIQGIEEALKDRWGPAGQASGVISVC